MSRILPNPCYRSNRIQILSKQLYREKIVNKCLIFLWKVKNLRIQRLSSEDYKKSHDFEKVFRDSLWNTKLQIKLNLFYLGLIQLKPKENPFENILKDLYKRVRSILCDNIYLDCGFKLLVCFSILVVYRKLNVIKNWRKFAKFMQPSSTEHTRIYSCSIYLATTLCGILISPWSFFREC